MKMEMFSSKIKELIEKKVFYMKISGIDYRIDTSYKLKSEKCKGLQNWSTRIVYINR